MKGQEFLLEFFLLICFHKCISVKRPVSKITNNEEFKVTVVIDPGKDENYLSLKAKAEELFGQVSVNEALKITLEMVNAARVGDLMYSSQSM